MYRHNLLASGCFCAAPAAELSTYSCRIGVWGGIGGTRRCDLGVVGLVCCCENCLIAMGRAPCCDERLALKKGPWTPDEDEKLVAFIQEHGHGNWRALPEKAGEHR